MATLASLCKHPVCVVTPTVTIRAAAALMRERHVGALVVVDAREGGGKRILEPIGIVTDRDIVVAIVALNLDPNIFLIDDLRGRPLVTARGEQPLHEGLELMKAKGVRRLPLVDKAGKLTGIVSMDDLLAEVARDLNRISDIIGLEIDAERVLRPTRLRRRQAVAGKQPH